MAIFGQPRKKVKSAVNYFFYLVVLAILVTWFKPRLGSLEEQRWPGNGLLERWSRKVDGWLTASGAAQAEVPPRASQLVQRVGLMAIAVAVFVTDVSGHQLTPFGALVGVAALVAFNRCTARGLPVLMALVIVAAVTVLLIYGIRESAKTNTTIVIIKVAVVVFFISFGAFMVHPTNWHPYVPNGFAGVMGGAAIIFFAFIGFDAVSTTAEETRNPRRDMPIGIIASLIICTLLYVLMGTVLTGIKKYTVYLGR